MPIVIKAFGSFREREEGKVKPIRTARVKTIQEFDAKVKLWLKKGFYLAYFRNAQRIERFDIARCSLPSAT